MRKITDPKVNQRECAILRSIFQGVVALFLGFIAAFDAEGKAVDPTILFSKVFPIKNLAELSINHSYGSVKLVGSSLDKVIVVVKRSKNPVSESVQASTGGKPNVAPSVPPAVPVVGGMAVPESELLQVRVEMQKGKLELYTGINQKLSLEERLKLKKTGSLRLDLEIQAPQHLEAVVWAAEGQVQILKWREKVDIRLRSGSVLVKDLKASEMMVLCPDCSVNLRDIRAKVRVFAGDRAVSLNDVESKSLHVETVSGSILAEKVNGDQIFVTRRGEIKGVELGGKIEFKGEEANVEFSRVRGAITGEVSKGDIALDWDELVVKEEGSIRNRLGKITVAFPESSRVRLEVDAVEKGIEAVLGKLWAKTTTVAGRKHLFLDLGVTHSETLRVISEAGRVAVLVK